MTVKEFYEKYKEYYDEGHYGLDIHIPEVVEYLDNVMQELIKRPDFKLQQIKLKFGMARFYANGITRDEQSQIEDKINQIVNN